MHKNLLIFEAGIQSAREYWLKELVDKGYILFLVQPWPLTWEARYVTEYLQCGFSSWATDTLPLLTDFCRTNRIDGILALNEGTVPFASELARNLRLPAVSNSDLRVVRNKGAMRDALKHAGIKQPDFIVLNADTQLFELQAPLNFPLVVKPAEMMASLGVRKVHNLSELNSAIECARSVDFEGEDLRSHYGLSTEVLIESYVPGTEYSVECFVQNGKVVEYFITQKFKCDEPFFDEIAHIANPVGCEIHGLESFLTGLHSSLKILNSVTHVELKVDGSSIFLIEIACRPGGDLIPFAHSAGSSFSFVEVAAKIATGEIIGESAPQSNRHSVAVFFPFIRESSGSLPTLNERAKEILDRVEVLECSIDDEAGPSVQLGLGTTRVGKVVFRASDRSQTANILYELMEVYR